MESPLPLVFMAEVHFGFREVLRVHVSSSVVFPSVIVQTVTLINI